MLIFAAGVENGAVGAECDSSDGAGVSVELQRVARRLRIVSEEPHVRIASHRQPLAVCTADESQRNACGGGAVHNGEERKRNRGRDARQPRTGSGCKDRADLPGEMRSRLMGESGYWICLTTVADDTSQKRMEWS